MNGVYYAYLVPFRHLYRAIVAIMVMPTFWCYMVCAHNSCKYLLHSSCQVSSNHKIYYWYEFTSSTVSLQSYNCWTALDNLM